MTDLTEVKSTRRGVKLHKENPFLGNAAANTKQGMKRVSNQKDGGQMLMVNSGSGEIVGPAGFWHSQEVDRTQFVKLFVNGVKAFKELTGAGTKVFELLYLEMQKQIGKDKVYLSFSAVLQDITPMSEATYARGMRELIAKNFVAPTTLQGWFFINPDYVWNGDRLAFVKEYRMKPTAKAKDQIDDKTMDLFGESGSVQQLEQGTKTGETED
jgi:hypothetical protein